MLKKVIMLACGFAVSGLCLYFAFRSVNFEELWMSIKQINPLAFVFYFMIRVTNFLVPALRSKILLSSQSNISYWQLVKSVLLAFAVNNIIPFRAGEVARVAYLSKRGELPLSTSAAIVGFERLLDTLALLSLVAILLPVISVKMPVTSSMFWIIGVVAIFIGGALWVSRYPASFLQVIRWVFRPFGDKAQNVFSSYAETLAEGLSTLNSWKRLFAVVGLTIVFWLLGVSMLRMWIWAFDIQVPWYAPIVLIAFLSIGLALPSAPGNIGVYHWLVIQAFAAMGVSQTVSGPYSVVVHAMALVPFTLLAFPLLYSDYKDLSNDLTTGLS